MHEFLYIYDQNAEAAIPGPRALEFTGPRAGCNLNEALSRRREKLPEQSTYRRSLEGQLVLGRRVLTCRRAFVWNASSSALDDPVACTE